MLSLINADDIFSITPAWVFHQFPETENIKKILLDTPCSSNCIYCDNKLNIHKSLRNIFGYNELDELIIRLTHKSVYLSSFKGKENIIFSLRSGEKLLILDGGLGVEVNNRVTKVLSYSKNMKLEIDKLLKNGFKIYDADIQFILAWKNNDNIEIPIILPNLYFKKY